MLGFPTGPCKVLPNGETHLRERNVFMFHSIVEMKKTGTISRPCLQSLATHQLQLVSSTRERSFTAMYYRRCLSMAIAICTGSICPSLVPRDVARYAVSYTHLRAHET